MKSAQMEQFKRKLESQREEASRLLHRVGDESRSIDSDVPRDSGDQSISTISKEFLFQQGSQRRGMVRRVEAASDTPDLSICVGATKMKRHKNFN